MIAKLGRYSIVERLGEGAMGIVYKAYDETLDRQVAIKTMGVDIQWDRELKQRFRREATSAGSLHHPNILTIHDFGEEGNITYIVMELLQGNDLRQFIRNKTSISLERKLSIMAQTADGLAHAHSNGIVHRDIKPGNIHIASDGSVKILDFGIARIPSSSLTRSGVRLGTPIYMSPEQVRDEEYDFRSDIFSTGIVFYELLTYCHPFRGKNISETLDNILFKTELPLQDQLEAELEVRYAGIPARLSQLVLRCLAKDPPHRFSDIGEFARGCVELQEEISQGSRRTVSGQGERVGTRLDLASESNGPGDEKDSLGHEKLRLGQIHLREGRIEKSLEYFRDALGLLGPEESIIRALTEARRRIDERNQSNASAQQQVAAEDTDVSTTVAMGTETTDSVVQRSKERVETVLAKAEGCMAEGDSQRALAEVREALRIDPQNSRGFKLLKEAEKLLASQRKDKIRVILASGRSALKKRDVRTATERAREILALDGENDGALDLLRRIQLHEEDQAREAARNEHIQQLVGSARQALDRRDFDGALRQMREIVASTEPEPAADTLGDGIKAASPLWKGLKERATPVVKHAANRISAKGTRVVEASRAWMSMCRTKLGEIPVKIRWILAGGIAALIFIILLIPLVGDISSDAVLEAQILAARKNLDEGNFAAAIQSAEQVLSGAPGNADAHRILNLAQREWNRATFNRMMVEAQTLRSDGRLEQSKLRLERALELFPADEVALSSRQEIEVAIVEGKTEAEQQEQLEIWEGNARLMISNGRSRAALVEVNKIGRLRPESEVLRELRRLVAATSPSDPTTSSTGAMAATLGAARIGAKPKEEKTARKRVFLQAESGASGSKIATKARPEARSNTGTQDQQAPEEAKRDHEAVQPTIAGNGNPSPPQKERNRGIAPATTDLARVSKKAGLDPPPSSAPASLSIHRLGLPALITLDGRPLGESGEAYVLEVPVGPHTVEIQRDQANGSWHEDFFSGMNLTLVYGPDLTLRPFRGEDRGAIDERVRIEEPRSYPVEHGHGFMFWRKCSGTLSITTRNVWFEPGKGDHGFHRPLPELSLKADRNRILLSEEKAKKEWILRIKGSNDVKAVVKHWTALKQLGY